MHFAGNVNHLLKQVVSQMREISATFIRSTLQQKDGLKTGKQSFKILEF